MYRVIEFYIYIVTYMVLFKPLGLYTITYNKDLTT